MSEGSAEQPEQRARRQIDAMLVVSGWEVQDKKDMNLAAAAGVVVGEFQTRGGPADYSTIHPVRRPRTQQAPPPLPPPRIRMLFERQKVLLALVEALGGRVPRTDMQKLLFLWTRNWTEGDPPFDFVPHRFGAFSFTSYADWRNLVKKGLLQDDEKDWALTDAGRLAIRKQAKVRSRAQAFVAKAPAARGEELVALTYHRQPFYAIHSEIAGRILAEDPRALERIEEARPSPGTPGIVTIGYEGRSLEAYLVALLKAGVTVLCDVRRNPVSRRYGFARSSLSRGCESVGLRYEHLPELGIASSKRRGLETQADYDALFEVYRRESLPNQKEALRLITDWVQAGDRVALTCFERLPKQCHRHCVAEALERDQGRPFAPVHL